MADYEALTIAPLCNADAGVLGDEGRAWLGTAGTAWTCPSTSATSPPRKSRSSDADGHTEPRRIEIGRAAATITFAHTLPTSRLPEGDLPGATVAVYRVHFADGATQDITIRERFEIGVSPDMTDRFRVGAPFLALPHVDVPAAPRDEVGRSGMGRALTDVGTPPLARVLAVPLAEPAAGRRDRCGRSTSHRTRRCPLRHLRGNR